MALLLSFAVPAFAAFTYSVTSAVDALLPRNGTSVSSVSDGENELQRVSIVVNNVMMFAAPTMDLISAYLCTVSFIYLDYVGARFLVTDECLTLPSTEGMDAKEE